MVGIKLEFLYFIILVLTIPFKSKAQEKKIDLIIEVNNDLAIGEIGNIRLEKKSNVVYAGYVPGHIIFDEKSNFINDVDTVILAFDHYFIIKGKQYVTNLKIELTPFLLSRRYLILSFYDFNDKNYKRWYQTKNNQNFAVDVIYPGSGILIRKK